MKKDERPVGAQSSKNGCLAVPFGPPSSSELTGKIVYCKGLTACAADPYYTNHVHNIGAKSIQNEAKSGPGAVPETLPKKSSKKLPKVNQKAPKVDQKAPQNDPKNVFKMIKNGLGAFVSTSKKR